MSCAALGSLWTKFCDSCSCSFGKFCDCSRNNVVVIGNAANPAAAAAVAAVLGTPDPDLRRDIHSLQQREVEAVQIRRATARMETLDDVQEREKEVQAGILEVVQRCLKRLGDKNLLSEDEKWCRLVGAGVLSGIDIQDKYRKKGALAEKGRVALERQVETVHKYGSAAAYLWKLMKSEKCQSGNDLEQLKRIGAVSRKQFEILWTLFQRADSGAVLAAPQFSAVNAEVLPLFFEAAQQFSDGSLAKIAGVFWNAMPRDSSHSAMHVISHASLTGPAADADLEREEKREDVPEAHALFEELGAGGRRSKEQAAILGMILASVLCLRLKISVEHSLKGDLTREEIGSIRRASPTLKKMQGAMCHIYFSLRISKDPLVLKSRYGFNDAVVKHIQSEFKANPHFFAEINDSEEMAALSTASLSAIWRIAEGFGEEEQAQMNGSYSLDDWRGAPQGSPLYHNPDHSSPGSASRSAAAGPASAAAAASDAREEVDRAMRAMRDMQLRRNGAPQEDRLRPIGHMNRGLMLAANFSMVDPAAHGGDA